MTNPKPGPVRGKLPSLIDDEPPVSSGRVPGAGYRPSTISTTMKGVAPLAAQGEVTETKPGLSALSHFHLAEAAVHGDDLAVAEDHARKAVEQDPAHVDAAILLAWVRGLGTARGAADDSVRELSRLLVEHPDNQKARFYRAKLLVRVNRFSEALADLNGLLATNPHHAEAQTEATALRARLSR